MKTTRSMQMKSFKYFPKIQNQRERKHLLKVGMKKINWVNHQKIILTTTLLEQWIRLAME